MLEKIKQNLEAVKTEQEALVKKHNQLVEENNATNKTFQETISVMRSDLSRMDGAIIAFNSLLAPGPTLVEETNEVAV